MLAPITEKMTDTSTGREYAFTFYCDICKKPWKGIPIRTGEAKAGEGNEEPEESASRQVWQTDHTAAFERANLEAMQHFNRCPVCRRWVCDQCFRILEDRDVCKECAEIEKGK